MMMFNLFDILQAQSGGVQSLGQQFGLSPDQSRRAMEALLPALTIGLQRNAAYGPAGFGRLFGLVGSDPRPGAQGSAQPDMLLGQLFGSPALNQAVLQQAAAASGIGQQALRQILPIMAGMVVAGIVHAMLNQPPAAPPPAREPEPQPVFAAAAFWNDWMNTFLSSTSAAAPKPDNPPPTRIERAASVPPRSIERPVETPPRPAPGVAKEPGAGAAGTSSDDVSLEVFQQIFQTGVQVQEQNVKAMQDIFDSFWSEPATGAGKAAPVAQPAGSEAAGTAGSSRKPDAEQPKPGKAR